MHTSICGLYKHYQFVFLSLPKLQEKKTLLVGLHPQERRKCDISSFSSCFKKPISKLNILTKAAAASSSPSLSGSGAEYSEQVLVEPKKKTQRISGIDQDELQDPIDLADPDSCFCEFNGVQLHHKVCDAEVLAPNTLEDASSFQFPHSTKRVNVPMILLHGFGASVFSWNRVMKPLAQVIGSKVLAFDRPAFGLTSRVNSVEHSSPVNQDNRPLNPYSMMFSVLATLYFIDFLGAEKAILVGHSAGSLVAVDAYFEAPERVAALILVAPAILTPFTAQKVVKEKEGAIVHMVKGMGEMINSLYQKALSAILRSAFGVMVIRMIIDKFGIPAVRNAWYDSNQVSDHILQGYTKPLKVKGWDKALVEYTVAMLTDSVSKLKPPLAERLSKISCPVLIVTGDSDRLVPPWNSERLSRAIPGSYLEIIKNCGHLPQEEKADKFVSIVENFLQRVFGPAEEARLQAVT
ncbi:alpha/beta-Hydrolases superfamily protein [Abeliophyllum distichum]|uniref:Alpha/beta-Hydrolases superfamily protein n=1 Tax=Abeliophyllum distichum TaxID=126358 RepID=A0ABD1UP95_9LAMI